MKLQRSRAHTQTRDPRLKRRSVRSNWHSLGSLNSSKRNPPGARRAGLSPWPESQYFRASSRVCQSLRCVGHEGWQFKEKPRRILPKLQSLPARFARFLPYFEPSWTDIPFRAGTNCFEVRFRKLFRELCWEVKTEMRKNAVLKNAMLVVVTWSRRIVVVACVRQKCSGRDDGRAARRQRAADRPAPRRERTADRAVADPPAYPSLTVHAG